MKKKSLGIVLLIAFLFVSPVRADSVTEGDISEELICQCGCNMVLSNCSHAECAVREAMLTFIGQSLAEGQSREQIIGSLVEHYGEQVLASPPKRGFNLTAWILPFAAILGGRGIIYISVRRWVRQGGQCQASTEAVAEEGDEEYQQRLEKELDDFTEESFR